MGLKSGLNPRPSNNTRLKTTLKYVAIGSVLATAMFLAIYYGKKQKDQAVREKRFVNLDDFKWKKTVVVNHRKVKGSEALYNFPLLIHLREPTLRSIAQGGMVETDQGNDIVFAEGSGEVMDFEIESYDPGTGELWVWVRIPELSPSSDTGLSFYYGNENILENLSTHFTWDNDFTGIWHLDGNIEDATSGKNSGNSTDTRQVSGKMGYAQQFTGLKNVNGSIIHIPDHSSLDLQEEGTIEAWIYVNSFQDWAGVIYKGDKLDFSDDAYFIQFLGGSERKRLAFGITSESGVYSYERSAIDLENKTWYHIAFTWDQRQIRLYVNGYDYGSKANNTVARNTPGGLNIGSQLSEAVENNPFDGIIDEVRVSKVARSPEWIATSFQNQSEPSNFISVQEPQPGLSRISNDMWSTNAFSSARDVDEKTVKLESY